jgi:hypothetical protein
LGLLNLLGIQVLSLLCRKLHLIKRENMWGQVLNY